MRYIPWMKSSIESNSPQSLVDALFGKTRKAVISKLFTHPEQSWHLRELARVAGVSPTMLSKEIDSLAASGIVIDSKDGNRRLIQANDQCPIFDELRGIARKTAGLADVIHQALLPLQNIDFAFIFGSVARGEERAGSDIDVCIVGSVATASVFDALSATETALGRPVNPIVYTESELNEKAVNGNHFVAKMIGSKLIFVIGNADVFRKHFGQS